MSKQQFKNPLHHALRTACHFGHSYLGRFWERVTPNCVIIGRRNASYAEKPTYVIGYAGQDNR